MDARWRGEGDVNAPYDDTGYDDIGAQPAETVDIAIIGAGLGGLCAAAKLHEAGLGRIVVFEKADGLGGVWRENRYPNIACDTPIDIYAISYFPGGKWTTNFAPGQEIHDYLAEFADTYGVTPMIRPRTEITQVVWHEATARWHITARDGRHWVSRIVIWSGGLLSQPLVPSLPGMDQFEGEMLHTTEWNDAIDLDGKTVAVVGAGASAIQVVPYVAEHARHAITFVRTPSYVMPRPDLLFRDADREDPGFITALLERRAQWFKMFERIAEARFPMNGEIIGQQEAEWRTYFDQVIQDPRLRDILAPAYRFGCKRPLFSNAYYPALTRPNVEVVGRGIARVEKNALIDTDGTAWPVDTIIWATGFDPQHSLGGLDIVGRDQTLAEAWRDIPAAYFGTLVAGFPNLFLINGPNVGGASATEFIEGQVRLIIHALQQGTERGAEIIDVPAAVQDEFNEDIQRRAQQSVMVLGNCNSYYRANGNGGVFTHWPGTIAAFREAVATQAPLGLRFTAVRGEVTPA